MCVCHVCAQTADTPACTPATRLCSVCFHASLSRSTHTFAVLAVLFFLTLHFYSVRGCSSCTCTYNLACPMTERKGARQKRHHRRQRVPLNEIDVEQAEAQQSATMHPWQHILCCCLIVVGLILSMLLTTGCYLVVSTIWMDHLPHPSPPPSSPSPPPSASPLRPPLHPSLAPSSPPQKPPPLPLFPPRPLSPPPPLPPPWSPPPLSKAEDLNARFKAGTIQAPASIYDAGVLVHQFDFMDASDPDGTVWLPGSGEIYDQVAKRCCKSTSDRGDRISATLINGMMQPEPSGSMPIYSFGLGGIILNPMNNSLLCSYPYDVGSMDRLCNPKGVSERCVPGCTHPWRANEPGGFLRCNHVDESDSEFPCAWEPADLSLMLQAREHIRKAARKPMRKDFDDQSELLTFTHTRANACNSIPTPL